MNQVKQTLMCHNVRATRGVFFRRPSYVAIQLKRDWCYKHYHMTGWFQNLFGVLRIAFSKLWGIRHTIFFPQHLGTLGLKKQERHRCVSIFRMPGLMVGGALSYMKVEKCPTTVGSTRLTTSSRRGRSVGVVSFVSCMLMNEVAIGCVRLSLATPWQAFILMSVEVPGELKSTLADLLGPINKSSIHIPIFAICEYDYV